MWVSTPPGRITDSRQFPSGTDPDVLIVSYRRADLLERCLRSVATHLPGSRVRVWDNFSEGSDAVAELLTRWPEVDAVFSPENIGFAAAVNRLMERGTSPCAFLLNPDAQLCGPLTATIRALEDPRVAAAAPWVKDDGHRPWDNAHREPTLLRYLVSYIGWDDRVRRLPLLSMMYKRQPHDVSGYLTGAGLLLSRAAWNHVGAFDERYFLYAEETDWCRRARDLGYALRAVPEDGIIHTAAGTVSDAAPASSRSAQLLLENQTRYLQDHHGRMAADVFSVFTRLADTLQPSKRRAAAAARQRSCLGRPLRVLVATAMYPSESDPVRGVVVSREVHRLRAAGLHVVVVDKAPGWRGYAKQAVRVMRLARGADLVHAHYGTTGFLVALVAPTSPLVVTMHGSDIAHGPRPALDKYWLQYLMSVAGAKRADRIIVQDTTMNVTLPASLHSRVTVLGQAVDVPSRIEPAPRREGVLFLSSRHRAVKRFHLAEAAFDLLPTSTTLTSLDQIPVPVIPEAMQKASVGLLTSEREGMPVAVKEALANGLRVVSVDLPALRPLAARLPDAVILTPHSPESVAAALEHALHMPPLTPEECSRIAEDLADQGWTEPARTEALLKLYTEVLEPPVTPGGSRAGGCEGK